MIVYLQSLRQQTGAQKSHGAHKHPLCCVSIKRKAKHLHRLRTLLHGRLRLRLGCKDLFDRSHQLLLCKLLFLILFPLLRFHHVRWVVKKSEEKRREDATPNLYILKAAPRLVAARIECSSS